MNICKTRVARNPENKKVLYGSQRYTSLATMTEKHSHEYACIEPDHLSSQNNDLAKL